MNEPIVTYKTDFETIYCMIAAHRGRVVQQINGETVMMVWEVGGFVSGKLKSSAWGSGVVRQLAEYIHMQDPTVRGWSYRTIYKMVQFYETYSSPAFIELIGKVKPKIVPFEIAQISDRQIMPIQSAQIQQDIIVPFEMAQIPTVLFSTGWCSSTISEHRWRTISTISKSRTIITTSSSKLLFFLIDIITILATIINKSDG